MNNKNNLFKKNEKFPQIKLDWSLVQSEMKIKLGKDIYESWVKNSLTIDKENVDMIPSTKGKID